MTNIVSKLEVTTAPLKCKGLSLYVDKLGSKYFEKVIYMSQNCWEFKKCGREPGGSKSAELGVCPAATDKRLDKIHNGKNSGRACWMVTGTLCKGEIQGVYAKKFGNCMNCDFYKIVKEEEYPNFTMSNILLKKLEDNK